MSAAKPTAAAMRAANASMARVCSNNLGPATNLAIARIIDRETGLPELVAALEGFLLWCGPTREDIVRAARAALARARGQS